MADSNTTPLTVLGIETSCDETAAALVRRSADGRGEILSNVVRSQLDLHAAYGGVVPEIAARAHIDLLDTAIRQALADAKTGFEAVDGVAAAAGPGLIGGLIVGLTTAKAMALGLGKPFIALNHLEAHALSAGLTDGLGFPYLLLLVSGGHTQLLIVKDVGAFERLGTTLDDAWGKPSTRRRSSGPALSRGACGRGQGRAGSRADRAAAADARPAGAAFFLRGAQDRTPPRGPRPRAPQR